MPSIRVIHFEVYRHNERTPTTMTMTTQLYPPGAQRLGINDDDDGYSFTEMQQCIAEGVGGQYLIDCLFR